MIDREHRPLPCRDPVLDARAVGTPRGVSSAGPGRAVGEQEVCAHARVETCFPFTGCSLCLRAEREQYRVTGQSPVVTSFALAVKIGSKRPELTRLLGAATIDDGTLGAIRH